MSRRLNRWYSPMMFASAAALLLTAALGTAPGALPGTSLGSPAPALTLDMALLAASNAAMTDHVPDPLWDIYPHEGNFLVQIPFTFTAPTKEITLGRPPISLIPGRFVCWRIETSNQPGRMDNRSRPQPRPRRTPPPRHAPPPPSMPAVMRDLPPGIVLPGMAPGQPPAQQLQPQHHPAEKHLDPLTGENLPGQGMAMSQAPGQGTQGGAALPAAAPRVARRITLKPDGSVRWKLDMAIPGEQVGEGYTDYMLKIRGGRLRDLFPVPPQPQPRQANQSVDQYRQSQEQAQQMFLKQTQVFTQRRERIGKLPSDFHVQNPPVIWAVFEISVHAPQFQLQGPAPFPWRLSFADLRLARRLAGANSAGGASGGVMQGMGGAMMMGRGGQVSAKQLSHLIQLVHTGPAMTQWLIGEAFAASKNARQMKTSGEMDQLAAALLSAKSVRARRAAARALASAQRQDAEAQSLLQKAVHDPDPMVKFFAMRGLLQERARGNAASTADQSQLTAMFALADEILQAPQGPPPADVLGELLDAVGRDGQSQALAASAVHFGAMPEARRKQAIMYVIQQSPDQDLAGTWLNEKLLGSSKPRVVRQTLTLLKKMKLATQGESGMRSMGRMAPTSAAPPTPPVMVRLPGQMSRQMSRVEANSAAGSSNRTASSDMDAWTLARPILIHTAQHHLVELLGSSDPSLRGLAWHDLDVFAIARDAPRADQQRQMRHPSASSSSSGPGKMPPIPMIGSNPGATAPKPVAPAPPPPEDPYHVIVDEGVKLTPTPAQLVPFLARQPDASRAAAALAQVLLRGDAAAGKQAAHALLADGRQLSSLMRQMSGPDRVKLAEKLYVAVDGKTSSVVGLLAGKQDRQVADWFTKQLQSGKLPPASAWASAWPDRKPLFTLGASKNKTVAHAAVAALVASIGGSAQTAAAMNQRLDQSGRTAQSVAQQWQNVRSDRFLQGLENLHAGGRYELRLAYAVEGQPQTRVTLATVTLVIDASGVKLANQTLGLAVGDQAGAITVPDLTELKNFDNAAIKDITFAKPKQPLELIHRADGSWRGGVRLADGAGLSLALIPGGA